MLKLVGAVLVLGATSWFGFYLAGSFSKRPRQIRQMQNGLQLLETEIVYGATPLSQALNKIGKQLSAPAGSLFQQAAEDLKQEEGTATHESWNRAIEQIWPKTVLRTQEKEILRQLGQALGRSDRADQQKHLRLTVQHLQGLEKDANEEQKKYEKLCKSMGVLGGLLITLLMI